ncbi:MAG: hypothetical protein VX303_03185, partial [Candidatus Thermoplasmatota archaeon]|nr:hypothetical protein [Candidatus Thermoplasmatota archaeon]
EIGALTPFLWHVILDPDKLSEGAHEIEVRAISGESNSLPVLATVHGHSSDGTQTSLPPIIIPILAIVFIIWGASIVLVKVRSDEEIDGIISSLRLPSTEIIDAEIVSDIEDSKPD